MLTFFRSPLFKIAGCIAIGIWLGKTCLPDQELLPLWGSLALGIAIIGWRTRRVRQWHGPWQERLQMGLLLGLLVLTGVLRWGVYTIPSPGSSLDETVYCQSVRYVLYVDGKVSKSVYGQQAWAKVIGFSLDSSWIPAKGRLIVRIRPDSMVDVARCDTLYVVGTLYPFRSKSAGYTAYIHREGIFHTLYVQQLVKGGTRRGVQYEAQQAQAFLSHKLTHLIPDTTVSQVARAMLLGDRTDLDRAWKQTFAQVGISHILAISGLHVGIIFLCLDKLLWFLGGIRYGREIKQVLILGILLGFMFISGASPAVVRAVMMFGAIILFRLFRKRYQILNVVSLAALIQLMVDPSLLWNLGFQLSYSAVIALVTIFPLFQQLFKSRWEWANHLSSTVGVTLVATLATLPLILLTFGQFPTYFLIANLLIGPLAFVAVFAGFLTLVCCWIPGVNMLLATITAYAISGMMWIAQFWGSQPAAVMTVTDWSGWIWLMLQLVITGVGLLAIWRWGSYRTTLV